LDFVGSDKDLRGKLTAKMKEGVEFAKRANAKWALVVPGRYNNGVERDYQTANVIDNLRYCAEACTRKVMTASSVWSTAEASPAKKAKSPS